MSQNLWLPTNTIESQVDSAKEVFEKQVPDAAKRARLLDLCQKFMTAVRSVDTDGELFRYFDEIKVVAHGRNNYELLIVPSEGMDPSLVRDVLLALAQPRERELRFLDLEKKHGDTRSDGLPGA